MEGQQSRRPGRPLTVASTRRRTYEIHLVLTAEILNALMDYSDEMGGLSLSMIVRKIVRERLVELGYVTRKSRVILEGEKSP